MFEKVNITPLGMKILIFLARHPEQEFYMREIAKSINKSVGGTHKALKSLQTMAFVVEKKSGKNTYYMINVTNPSVKNFKIFMTTTELNQLITDLKIITESNPRSALDRIKEENVAVIVSDQKMPGMSGIEVLNSLRAMYRAVTQPPVIFLSARGGMEAMLEGLQAGAYKYLVKPTSREKLVEVIKAALEYSQQKRHPEIEPPDWM